MNKSIKTMIGASFATTAAVVAFAPQVSAEETYTIESGDTLFSLSREFDTTIDELIQLNHIEDANLIIAGEHLTLPGAKTVENNAEDGVYTVVSGDTLNKIAAQFNTTAQHIRDLNGITGDLILVGQQLKVAGEVEQATVTEETVGQQVETPVVAEEAAPVVEETVEAPVQQAPVSQEPVVQEVQPQVDQQAAVQPQVDQDRKSVV